MRALWIALPLMLAATPAVAAPDEDRQLPPEISDPAMADKLGKMLGPLTRALMDMPVGELEAVAEGRQPTAADKARKVRDAVGGPEAERRLTQQIEAAGPRLKAMQQALVASLPSIMKSLEGVEQELERATANIPDPTYPKR